ncbi:MAG TPA: Asp-tRNA(Asn)/Glu-tRNA(Gln) amidotransferase subunit GatC [Thermopetrobacter sp.]|nr:Asp-tRNA(Asn)/Glu-tRNA(Gln) amidotransferase subunit GatC [Thermopetrobacter sp.]
MAVDEQIVRKVARLARIRLDDDKVESMARELAAIFAWIDQLSEVDTRGVEPMTSVEAMAMKKRPDVVTDGDRVADVLANAPAREGDFFVVPKVVE